MDLARSLTLSGLAWHSRNYATSETLIEHERRARAKEKNLWSQSDPTAPWVYRDAQGKTSLLEAIHDGYQTAREGYRWGRWLWSLFS